MTLAIEDSQTLASWGGGLPGTSRQYGITLILYLPGDHELKARNKDKKPIGGKWWSKWWSKLIYLCHALTINVSVLI